MNDRFQMFADNPKFMLVERTLLPSGVMIIIILTEKLLAAPGVIIIINLRKSRNIRIMMMCLGSCHYKN